MLLVSLASLTGCGSDSSTFTAPPPTPPTSQSFTGVVTAGGSAAAGVSVRLYAASTSGYATAATALLSAATTTDSTGNFTVSGQYTCPAASTQLYLLAHGTSTHSATVLLTALGSCGSIVSGQTFTVNEVTTAAFVWSLVPFMASATSVGTSSANAAGLANAFLTAQLLADSATGKSPATATASTVTIESAKVYSLANALAPCASTAVCTALFTAATSGGIVPTDTAAAALAVVKHPAANVAAVYQSGATTSPFAGLSAAPADWTMTIASTGGGMNSPENVSVDSTGRAWVVSYLGLVNSFTITGTPVFPSGLTAPGLSESIGVTVDPSDNVWATSGTNDAVMEFSKSGTVLSGAAGYKAGGIRYPSAVAADASGNVWVVNNGNSSVTKLSSSGVPSQSNGYTANGALQFGLTVAIDSKSTPWIATAGGTAVHLAANGSLIRSATCCAIPNGIAIDGNDDPWVADQYGSAI
ncbi:MAG: NHL repeat-containing protein, partial [Bryocella sp.]